MRFSCIYRIVFCESDGFLRSYGSMSLRTGTHTTGGDFVVCLCTLFTCLFVYLSVSICLSICLSVCLSICMSVCLFIYLFVCLFVCCFSVYLCLLFTTFRANYSFDMNRQADRETGSYMKYIVLCVYYNHIYIYIYINLCIQRLVVKIWIYCMDE